INPALYTGMYGNDGYGEFVISRSGDNLSISYYGSSWTLQPTSATQMMFVVPAFGTHFPVLVFFAQNDAGAVTGFSATLVLQPHPILITF
ncbi:hypothetical protein ACO1KS_14195, partial [Staphylococcus aureus]